MGESISYRQNRQGIYIPMSSWPEINETLEYGESLSKKVRDGQELNAYEKKTYQMYRKMGALHSTFHQSLYQNATSYGASDKPQGQMSHRLLREAAKKSAIDAAIINARMHQVRHVAKRVVVEGKQKGFTVRHKRVSDPSFKNTSGVKKVAQEIEDVLFTRINRDVHGSGGFRDFMVKAVQDELIVDRKVLIVMRDRRMRPLSYHLLPPDDIKPRTEVLLKYIPGIDGQNLVRRYSSDDMNRGRDIIFERFGVDVTNAAYIQEVDNIVTGAWSVDECSVDITAPNNELDQAFYGVSCLERSLEVTYLLMQAFNQNKEIFNQEMPDNILALAGEVDPVGLQSLMQLIKGTGKRDRMGIIAMGDIMNKAEMLKLRDTPREMEMVQLIRIFTALKCSYFRAHPSLLNFNPDSGQDKAPVIANQSDAFEIDLSQEEGLGSLLENSAFWMTRELLEPVPEWEEFEVVVDLPKIQSEQEITELWTEKTASFCTVDEARAAQGLKPLADVTQGRARGDYMNNPFFGQAVQTQHAETQEQIQDLMSGPSAQGDEGWTLGNDEQGTNGQQQPQRPPQQKAPIAKSWTLA